MDNLLEVKAIQRTFGLETAVESVSFQVEYAETCGILLPDANSLETRTLLHLLGGFLEADQGHIFFNAEEITQLSPLQRAEKGLVQAYDEAALFPELTIADHILAVSRNLMDTLNDLYAQWRNDSHYLRKGMKRLSAIGLDTPADTQVAQLDTLQKNLLGLGLATLTDFSMLIWPLLNFPKLSDEQRNSMRYIMSALEKSEKTTLLISEHEILLEDFADRILIFENGKLHDEDE